MKTVFLDFNTLHPDDLDITKIKGQLTSVQTWPDTAPEQIADRLSAADVAVVNKVRLDATMLQSIAHLRLICLAATGTDNVDLNAAKALGIAVANIRDYCTPSVVQHVFALVLALTQHLTAHRAAIDAGEWQRTGQFCLLEPTFNELRGKTLGVIGLGTLGSGVATIARAFGMHVIAAQLPWRSSTARASNEQAVPRLPFQQLLRQSDIVSLHCPLTADTHHLIDADAIAQMQKHALLINTARGGLVDSAALLGALENNDIGGAGIDVLETEPPNDSEPLIRTRLPNLIVTPHIAWSAVESRQRALDEILANIIAFSRGEERNRVC